MRILPPFLYRRIAHRPLLAKIADNMGWLLFDKVLRMGVGLFVAVWIARYLGPKQYGLLNFCTAFIGLFATIATLGLQSIVVRDLVRNPKSASTILYTAAFLQLISGLVSYLILLVAIRFISPEDDLVRVIVAILGLGLLFKASEIVIYWFESQVQSKYTVLVQNAVFLIAASINVILILQKAPLIEFVWLMFAEAAVAAVILLVVMRKLGPSLSCLSISLERAKNLLKDSWPLILSSIAIMIYMRIDQIMLGEMIGYESVGVFSAAAKISEAWYFVPMLIVNSVFPSIVKAKMDGMDNYLKNVQRLYDLLAMISVSVAILITIISEPLMQILYGSDFRGAGAILCVQIWSGVFVSMGLARGKWLLVEDLQRIGYWYILLAMIINILGNYLLIPKYGALGAALVSVFSQASAAIIAPSLFKKTRLSVVMLIRSLNPVRWIKLISDFRVGFLKL